MGVLITDVTPRDGLQDAVGHVPLDDKVALVRGLVAAGIRTVEATAFVHPKWVPMLTDGDALLPRLRDLGATLVALVPNERGVQRALDAGASRVTLVASASESHNRANLNRSRNETWEVLRSAARRAHEGGLQVRGAISTAFDCPFEGTVPVADVVSAAERYLEIGVDEIGLADTIGTATPAAVRDRVRALVGLSSVPLALHLHDRYGWALANVAIARELGVQRFESALGGLGGCPYAPGAAGNLDTELLVAFFFAQGELPEIDRDALARARERLQAVLAKRLPVAAGPAASR